MAILLTWILPILRSNRTFMELKLTMSEARGRAEGSNRTFMELKFPFAPG